MLQCLTKLKSPIDPIQPTGHSLLHSISSTFKITFYSQKESFFEVFTCLALVKKNNLFRKKKTLVHFQSFFCHINQHKIALYIFYTA